MKTESPANSDGNRPHRVRSREQTAADLWAAVERLQSNEGMPTIADVARDVGVTPALIHNRYPDIADRLRGLARKDPGSRRQDEQSLLDAERLRTTGLRAEVEELRRQVRALASVNEALRRELAVQSAMVSGKVVPLGGRSST